MVKKKAYKLDKSYLTLPSIFHSVHTLEPLPQAEMLLYNEVLSQELWLDTTSIKDDILSCIQVWNREVFAQAYAGHQFGHFTMLGDGRASMFGEYILKNWECYDIQFKWSGRTLYSRDWDGKATLRVMLREYIISEAMHWLGIPSSRSLAIIQTWEKVYRNDVEDAAVLVRIMKSHLRIGTFEFAYAFWSKNDIQKLTDYTIGRLYPDLSKIARPALSLLEKAMQVQIQLVCNWLRVGFIHWVMNTDNTSISWETFDYGPCAFLNSYNPYQVYSSIDSEWRYAFWNQKNIIYWNLCRFAETLLPIMDDDSNIAIEITKSLLESFEDRWQKTYHNMIIQKIWFQEISAARLTLARDFLNILEKYNLDYTLSFAYLSYDISYNTLQNNRDFMAWYKKWRYEIEKKSTLEISRQIMRNVNPAIIPRNHIIEEILYEGIQWNMDWYIQLLQALRNPYKYSNLSREYLEPPSKNYDRIYQTYCGT